jgi:hypothetical protein
MTVRLRDHVSHTHTEDGGVLLDQRSGQYWQINSSASVALRMMLAGAEPCEAAMALVADCRPGEADIERAALDVREFIEQLTAAELVERT